MFRSNIEKLSEILDETIEKGLRKTKSKIERYEQDLVKGLSHDPFRPVEMGYDSPYYSPYRVAPEGGFLPYTTEHWVSQGKQADAYLTTSQFYDRYGDVERAIQGFRGFGKSVARGELIKAEAVPVGTVHTYADGQKYKKISEGKWAPVLSKEGKRFSDGMKHPDPNVRAESHKMLEDHAGKHKKIKDHIGKKESELRVRDETTKHVTKEVMGHVKKLMGHMFDGEPPKEVGKVFETAERKAKITPDHHLKDMSQDMSAGRTHDIHVKFKIDGTPYEHTFPQVQGTTTVEAQERVVSAIKKQFGENVTLDRLSVRRPKDGDKPKTQDTGAEKKPAQGKGEKV